MDISVSTSLVKSFLGICIDFLITKYWKVKWHHFEFQTLPILSKDITRRRPKKKVFDYKAKTDDKTISNPQNKFQVLVCLLDITINVLTEIFE